MHHEFYHLAKKIIDKKTKMAMATVLHVQGSAYRREGTRMLVDAAGKWFGNISGGCLEGDILSKTQSVIKSGESMLITYDTRESKNKEIRIALGCNGVISLLIEPVSNELRELSRSIIHLFENEETAFLITQIEKTKESLQVNHQISVEIPESISTAAFKNENFCHVEKSNASILLYEYLGLRRKMVIWGSGPDVGPVSNFATQLGWLTIVTSDCDLTKFKSDLPEVALIQSNFDDFISNTKLHSNTAVLLVSHDFYKDYFILEKIIQKDVKYIGIMGPKRRGERMIEEFRKRNPKVEFDENKIHYPVGLDIGSDNPVEIALSIVAEVQSAFSGKNAAPLKDKNTRIHNTGTNDEIETYNPTNTVCSINNF